MANSGLTPSASRNTLSSCVTTSDTNGDIWSCHRAPASRTGVAVTRATSAFVECRRSIVGTFALGIDDSGVQRFAHRLRAVYDFELAQDLLDVVLHRERADRQDRADFGIALAEVNPLQDFALARGEHTAADHRRAFAPRRFAWLRANP